MVSNERLKHLERLLEVVRMVSKDLDDLSALQSIVSIASELTQSEVASILRYDKEDGYLRFVAVPWFHRDSIENVRVPVGESIAGWVFKYGKPLVIQDVKGDQRFYSEVDKVTEFQTRSILAVPLFVHGEPVGVFEAINKTNRAHYNGEDVTILETLASIAALILQNHSLRENMQVTKDEANRLDQMKKDFVAITSHELRTPLGLILGHSTFLREVIDENYHDQLDAIIRNGEKLKAIIENMSSVDNYQSGLARLRISQILINDLVRDVVAAYSADAETKQISLNVDFHEQELLIEGDSDKIKTIVNNLLKNAITFTSEGGNVWVTIQKTPDYVEVSIADDGIGIRPEDLEHIFERFYQVETHLTRHHNGMGLGLSVARQMVEMHGGNISVESAAEKGSRFRFRLPIKHKEVDLKQSGFDTL